MRYIFTAITYSLLVKHSVEYMHEGAVLFGEIHLPTLQCLVNESFTRRRRRRSHDFHIYILNGGLMYTFQNKMKELVCVVKHFCGELFI